MSGTEAAAPRALQHVKQVLLAGTESAPRRFLLLSTKRSPDGLVTGSYWRLAEPFEPDHTLPPQSVVDELAAARILRSGGAKARGAWRRKAARAESLEDLLYALLKEQPGGEGWETVTAYVRATGWGAEL